MVLAVAFLVLATIELVLNLDDVWAFNTARLSAADPATPSESAGAAGFAPVANTLRYLGLRLTSYYLADVLPIAGFIAVFITLAVAGRSLEILAIESGGVRPIRVIAPILATALILSLATAVLHETVILRADRIWSGQNHDRESQIEFRNDSFWYHNGGTITNITHADPETRTLHKVEIFERSPEGRVLRVVRAERVRVAVDGIWHIEDARIWRFEPDDIHAEPTLEESASVILDLGALRGDLLLGADPKLLTLPDLARYLDSDPRVTPAKIRQAWGRYHQRLSSPWLVLAFALLAMPFALRVDGRGRIAGPATAAVFTLSIYFLLESIGRALAQEELIPVGITPWLTMALFSITAAFGIFQRAR